MCVFLVCAGVCVMDGWHVIVGMEIRGQLSGVRSLLIPWLSGIKLRSLALHNGYSVGTFCWP